MEKKKSAAILILAAFAALFFALDLDSYLSLEALKAHRDALKGFAAEHRLATAISFVLLYILQTALALPGAIIFSLAAGALFGAMLGTVYAVIAATLGAVVSFLATRYLLQESVQKKFGGRMVNLNGALEKEGLNYLLFLRLVPLFPFFSHQPGGGRYAHAAAHFLSRNRYRHYSRRLCLCECRSQPGQYPQYR